MIKTEFMEMYEELGNININEAKGTSSFIADESNVLTEEEIAKLNAECDRLRPIVTTALNNYKIKQKEIKTELGGEWPITKDYPELLDLRNKYFAIRKELGDIEDKLSLHERTVRYLKDGENAIATEADWEECLDRLPCEFTFELDLEIREDADEYPSGWDSRTDSITYTTVPARTGYINSWDMEIEVDCELVARYLDKKVEEITVKDLLDIDDEDFNEFVITDDKCMTAAEDDARENYDYDDVSWEDPYDESYDDRDYWRDL